MRSYSIENSKIPEAHKGSESSVSHTAWYFPGNYFPTSGKGLNHIQGSQVNPPPALNVAASHSIAPSTEFVNNVNSRNKTTKVKDPKSSVGGLNRIRSKLFRTKKRKRPCSSGKIKGPIIPETKREKKNPYIFMDGTNIDFSGVPSPICSCTGIARVCYKWGGGGWQSSCCTLVISEYPLRMSSTRPGARIAGRKMSNGAYMKLLVRLAAAGHDLSVPVDLKNHWARHGTNNFVTIK